MSESTVSVYDVLTEAERLIREGGWCQHTSARTANGLGAGSNSPRAVAFCVSGACYRAAHDMGDYTGAMAVLHKISGGSAIDYNDAPGRTKDEVLAKFAEARAIALQQQEASA